MGCELMSILPCDLDPVAVGVHVDGYWDLDPLREHVAGCRRCENVRRALAAMTGSQGGSAGGGDAKRRGDGDYYRALSRRGRNKTQDLVQR